MLSKLTSAAIGYMKAYGDRACAKAGDDISRAIGKSDWEEAHRLQRAQLRISRLQYCEQIASRLTDEKKESYAAAWSRPAAL